MNTLTVPLVSRFRRMHRAAVGQAVLEFALVTPILFGFVMFIIDISLFGFSYLSVTNSVREGARCAAVGGTSAAVSARVTDTAGGLANVLSVAAPSYSPSPAQVGGSVTVTATYTYDWVTPVGLLPGVKSTLDFSKSATMRMETANTTTKTSC